jgi:hypothetical protein
MLELVRKGYIDIRVKPNAISEAAKTLSTKQAVRVLLEDASWFDPAELLTPCAVVAVATAAGDAFYLRQMRTGRADRIAGSPD